MISNHKIQAALDEIKEISKIDLALYTDKGKQVAATFETEGDMEYAVNSFAGSMAESQMLSGCHFFKVYVDGELEYVLLTKSSAEDAYMVGRLAVCQIRTLVSAYMEQFDRNNFMQNILLGNMLMVDMYNKAQKLHIEQAERVVFVIELEGKRMVRRSNWSRICSRRRPGISSQRWTSRALCSSKIPERWERTRILRPWRQ